MALTKVTRSGITDNSVNAAKIEDGTVVDADITPGTITPAKLASTLDLSSKTVTLPNTSVTNAMLAGSIANDKLANSSITINGVATVLGGSVNAGSLAWQSVKTADFNAVAGEGYFVDTNSVGAVTATLPASPSAGDTVAIKDYAGTFATNNLTIARNGSNIQGVANDSLISTNRASIVLVYIDATKGWLYTNESNVADLENKGYITATGGTITTSGDFKIHTFTGDGNFVVSTAGIGTASTTNVDYLVVAGGGGGAAGPSGGGGGAGGFREAKDSDINSPHTASPLAATTGITVSATTYPITVGGGGSGGNGGPEGCNTTQGTNGSNSIFSTITSAGGGRAQGASSNPCGGAAGNGGSGGGAGGTAGAFGSGNTPTVSPAQGNDGEDRYTAGSPTGGGGGGGATSSSGNTNADGGTGATTSISTTATAYAGGGGSGASGSTCIGSTPRSPLGGGNGGTGGGGSGSRGSPTPGSAPNGGAGTANTGGGGGGAGSGSPSNAGAGGSGIVMIRYRFQ